MMATMTTITTTDLLLQAGRVIKIFPLDHLFCLLLTDLDSPFSKLLTPSFFLKIETLCQMEITEI